MPNPDRNPFDRILDETRATAFRRRAPAFAAESRTTACPRSRRVIERLSRVTVASSKDFNNQAIASIALAPPPQQEQPESEEDPSGLGLGSETDALINAIVQQLGGAGGQRPMILPPCLAALLLPFASSTVPAMSDLPDALMAGGSPAGRHFGNPADWRFPANTTGQLSARGHRTINLASPRQDHPRGQRADRAVDGPGQFRNELVRCVCWPKRKGASPMKSSRAIAKPKIRRQRRNLTDPGAAKPAFRRADLIHVHLACRLWARCRPDRH